MSWWLILQLFSSPNLNIYRLLKITIYSLWEKSTEKRSKKTRLRALFQSLMWSANLIIINNDDIREYFEDKDNIGGNCYNSNCVTQLMLYTGDKLSSPIFCCLWVSESVCQASITPDQISTFSNIQAYKHFTDQIQYIKA